MRYKDGIKTYNPADHAVPDTLLVINLKRSFWVGVLVCIWLCIIPQALWKYHQWRLYSPTINPNPQYFLTVHGHVDPGMRRDLSIQWHASYMTTNDACKSNSSWSNTWFSDEPVSDHFYYFDYPVKIESNGSYQLKIPMDAVVAGSCRWKLDGLDYSYKYKRVDYQPDFLTSIPFKDTGNLKKQLVQIWTCDASTCDTKKDIFNENEYLNSKKSQHINVSFIQGERKND